MRCGHTPRLQVGHGHKAYASGAIRDAGMLNLDRIIRPFEEHGSFVHELLEKTKNRIRKSRTRNLQEII